ncbi:polyprenyl synthetase family protein [candidate division KSB1 bacterium]|nr:polyprenyl synthetase family protein [candidate division KSB1 bacterium]
MNIAEIAEPVKEFFEKFDAAFEEKFHSQVPLVDKVVNYIATKKGKLLRPLLVFLTAKLHGELVDKTMSAALVVEMFHTATLVHDDVVDESRLRRGSRTVNDIWDNKISILIGDLLFSKTLASIVDLHDTHAVAILSAAAERITEGELLQIVLTDNSKVTEEEYFDLISKKTASLFSAACRMGALSIRDDETALKNMAGFGENYGIAFQIRDDLLDYLGEADKLGKPTGNDLREGKVTLPLIHALNIAPSAARDKIFGILEHGIKSDEEIDHIVKFVLTHGGVDYAKKLVRQFAARALDYLKPYQDSAAKKSLIQLVNHSTNRDK